MSDDDKTGEKPKRIRKPKRPMPQVFEMIRHADETGVSGTGSVGYGTILSSGAVLFEWFGATPSENRYPSFDAFLAVHVDSHPDNNTEIRWLFGGPDPDEEDEETEEG